MPEYAIYACLDILNCPKQTAAYDTNKMAQPNTISMSDISDTGGWEKSAP